MAQRELLESRLQILAEDSVTLQALKMVFEEQIEKTKPEVGTDSDEVVGQRYRAYDLAKNLLRQTLIDIESYKNKKVDQGQISKEN